MYKLFITTLVVGIFTLSSGFGLSTNANTSMGADVNDQHVSANAGANVNAKGSVDVADDGAAASTTGNIFTNIGAMLGI